MWTKQCQQGSDTTATNGVRNTNKTIHTVDRHRQLLVAAGLFYFDNPCTDDMLMRMRRIRFDTTNRNEVS